MRDALEPSIRSRYGCRQALGDVRGVIEKSHHGPGGQVNGIDVAIGRRLRDLRLTRGLSSEEVATWLGIAHGQLQLYEAGLDRLSAGRLFEFAQLLDVPVGAFYEAVRLPQNEPSGDPADPAGRVLRLARAFDVLPEAQKRAVFSLVQSLSFMQSPGDELPLPRRRDGS